MAQEDRVLRPLAGRDPTRASESDPSVANSSDFRNL